MNLLLRSILIAFVALLLPVFYKHGMKLYITYYSSSQIEFSTNCDVSLAYILTGSSGDEMQLKRILQAIYHPSNIYVVSLGSDTWSDEYKELSDYIENHNVFSGIGNVKLGRSISDVMCMHKNWDWLIFLDVYSYPMFTQDDLICALSTLPRHLNFIDHARLSPPFRNSNDHDEFFGNEVITLLSILPVGNTTIFEGSTLMALTPSLLEYYTRELFNVVGYNYQTAICNSKEFRGTVVNTSLHFTATGKKNLDFMTKLFEDLNWVPHYISSDGEKLRLISDDRESNKKSHAPFARRSYGMLPNSTLSSIDEKFLFRRPDKLVPGGWCAGTDNGSDPCSRVGNVTKINATKRVWHLMKFFSQFVHNGSVISPQCVY